MMYAEFTELITGGIQQGSERKLVINLDKVIDQYIVNFETFSKVLWNAVASVL